MTYFLKSGSQFNVSTQEALDLHDTLPVDTYTVGYDQMSGAFFLKVIEGFEIKGKLYGDTTSVSNRILDTFLDRNGSTGVMLSGEKGSGKTLQAKKLALDAADRGIPTIVINQPWAGEAFNGFMQMIEQPTVVIFDEFEKVYDDDDQQKLLTLLDGVYPSQKLFILTCNDKSRVNSHLQNRPGRIFYRLDYKGLTTDFITEYCEDNLKNKKHIDSICRISALFTEFNFDILKAMVEEMNRYDESPQDVMKILNAKPELSSYVTYDIELWVEGVKLPSSRIPEPTWRGNPLHHTVHTYYLADIVETVSKKKRRGDDDDEIDPYENISFTSGDLKSVDANTGRFTFEDDKKNKITLVKAPIKEFNYDAF